MDNPGAGLTDQRRPVRRVAFASLLAALVLVVVKLVAALLTGSLSLLSEAAHSGLDAMVTLLTLVAVSVAARPPDADHPYGHGRAENVAAMLEAVALLLLSISIGRNALLRLGHHRHLVSTPWYAFGAIGLSILVDASRSRGLARAGRRYASPALQADAVHFRADLLTSAVVLAGLGAVRLGFTAADALGGLVIAVYVGFSSLRLGRRSIDALMDRAPEAAIDRIQAAAGAVQGVEEVRRVRVRYPGGQPQADVVVAVSRTVPLELAHDLTEQVEQAVRRVEPGAEVLVHVEPMADEQYVAERVLSISARHPGVHQVHNVFVARQPDGLHIALHAKFPESMSLVEAHAMAERLEADITAGVEGVSRVDTHLEPLEARATEGRDVTASHQDLVSAVTTLAEGQAEVRNCHEVVVTHTDGGLSVVMHCEASPGLTVARVHDTSTSIENAVHRHWPEVERVTVHFEPAVE